MLELVVYLLKLFEGESSDRNYFCHQIVNLPDHPQRYACIIACTLSVNYVRVTRAILAF